MSGTTLLQFREGASPTDLGAADVKAIISSWGLKDGGKIEISLRCSIVTPAFDYDDDPFAPRPLLYLKLHTSDHCDNILSRSFFVRQTLCMEPALFTGDMTLNPRMTESVFSFQLNITYFGEYSLALCLCSADEVDVLVEYALVNPGGFHDSIEQTPMLNGYIAFLTIYLCIFGLYTGWLADKKIRSHIHLKKIEYIIASTMFVKVVDISINMLRVRVFSSGRTALHKRSAVHEVREFRGDGLSGSGASVDDRARSDGVEGVP